jgi:hypothetical protein
MNNIDTNKIKNELIRKLKIGIPRDTGSILWQLIDAVETLQQNQNKLLEKIQELEYTTSRLSSNEYE